MLCHKKKGELVPQTIILLTPEQIAERRLAQARDLASWQIKMQSPITAPDQRPGSANFVDLSGRLTDPGQCAALLMDRIPQIGQYMRNYPILHQSIVVKLPIRQLHQFPEAIRNEFAAYDPEHLDLYFIVWQDISEADEDPIQQGKRNILYHPIAFPDAQFGETHNQDLLMGMFEPEGIEVARGPQNQALSLNQFGSQSVHIHPNQDAGQPMVMCVSPDEGRFYNTPERASNSFYSACKFPNNRAAAFFGVILKNDPNSLELAVLSDPLRSQGLTLQEYKTGIENGPLDRSLADKITRLLNFHRDTSES